LKIWSAKSENEKLSAQKIQPNMRTRGHKIGDEEKSCLDEIWWKNTVHRILVPELRSRAEMKSTCKN
jgi:hypothetical protein